jgi:hypothetical protein
MALNLAPFNPGLSSTAPSEHSPRLLGRITVAKQMLFSEELFCRINRGRTLTNISTLCFETAAINGLRTPSGIKDPLNALGGSRAATVDALGAA